MTLQHLQSQLLALSTEEQVQAIQLLTANLNGTWINIERFPDSPQGDAFIRQTGIAVWFIIHRRNQGTTDADLLAEYPDLNAVDLANAWLYAQLHNDDIQAAIQRHTTDQLPDPDDDPKEEILSDLKQAWQEAQSGHTIPLSQMWNGIDV